MTIQAASPRSVAGLASNLNALPTAFKRIFSINEYHPACQATPELNKKYGVPIDNVQTVVCVTNNITHDVSWYNPERGSKPQNFAAAHVGVSALDPLTKGGTCDFCNWEKFTARDTGFGRIEGPYAVSASNLFKYCAPAQGVVLFKHHDPLSFTQPQLADLLNVASGWFDHAAQAAVADGWDPSALHPLLVWNCLNRAGASQFHGHAQTMLSAAPLPQQQRDAELHTRYKTQHPGSSYLMDVYTAHDSVGLARSFTDASGESASCYASVCPWKDAELVIHGSHLTSPAFQFMFYCALRALIDELGIVTFNAGIHGIPLTVAPGAEAVGEAGLVARIVGRGKLASAASDYGGLEVFAGASIAHSEPYGVIAAVDSVLQKEGVS